MGNLKNKNVLVTGTSQGIGAAIAYDLIECGCNVFMHYYRNEKEPKKMMKRAKSLGQKAFCYQADLTSEKEVSSLFDELSLHFDVLDILVNNSGSLVERRDLGEVDLLYWRKLIDVNLTTMMLVTKYALPFLNVNEGSSIVNLASLAGRKGGHAGSLVYSTTKGAVITWTRSLSNELGSDKIRVNTVAPGLILGTSFHEEHTSEKSAINTINGIPLGRAGNPQDVARVVKFLASEYDGFITGETIDINGGVYCA